MTWITDLCALRSYCSFPPFLHNLPPILFNRLINHLFQKRPAMITQFFPTHCLTLQGYSGTNPCFPSWISNAQVVVISFISRRHQQPVSWFTHAESASVWDVGHCTQLYSVSCCEWPTVAELSALIQSTGVYCCTATPHLKVLTPPLQVRGCLAGLYLMDAHMLATLHTKAPEHAVYTQTHRKILV